MGVVYRARDLRLDREVAIKVLPADFSSDLHRLERFEVEARSTSALNHPNILTVFDVGTHEDSPYIVAELLEGTELREILSERQLTVRESLEFAKQLAAGLAAAHGKGIVHRDLKPENVFITGDGLVKILDFGLAKLHSQPNQHGNSQVATQRRITDPGTVMGTVGYMSPEQVRGQEVDQRSDIFSFGVILYEMLSGTQPFARAWSADVLSAILKEDPAELIALNAMVSPALERLVRHCLEKRPEQRFQSMLDVGYSLESLVTPSIGPERAQSQTGETEAGRQAGGLRRTERLVWAASTVLLALAALILGYLGSSRSTDRAESVRTYILPPEKTSFKSGGLNAGPVSVSPDGRSIAFVATTEDGRNLLWVRSLSSLSAQSLGGTDGASFPFWSPDSHSLGFFAEGKLKTVDASGGPVFVLCDAPAGRGGSWNQNGVIIFAPNHIGTLQRVSSSGGIPTEVTSLDSARGELAHRWPFFLPDGKHFLYLGATLSFNASQKDLVYSSSLDGKERKVVLSGGSNVAYAQGYLLFVRQPTLMAQSFDVTKLTTTGDAFPIAEQILYFPDSTSSVFSVSENGVLAYQSGSAQSGSQLVWLDRSGNRTGVIGEVARYAGPSLSPDGKTVALDISEPQTSNIDIWLVDALRGPRTRFTFDRGIEISSVWSPDGKRLAFASDRRGHLDIYQKATVGVGREELLLESDFEKFPQSYSRDGRYLLYYARENPRNQGDLWVLPLSGDRKPLPFYQSEFNEEYCSFSPDGHWIAYQSDESGKSEIYFAPFPGPGGKRQVSGSGGSQPKWRRDGKEIFFIAPDGRLMSAEVNGNGETLEIGIPRVLFQPRATGPGFQFDVADDGQRFLFNTVVEQKNSTQITLVLNWAAGLKR
jgi:serine/threonine protein kinase